MIAGCKNRVKTLLAALDPPVPESAIHLGKEGLSRHVTMPMVVLVTGKEETRPMGDLVGIETDQQAGVRRYTYRRAARFLQLAIIVFHRTEEEAEAILRPVIAGLLDVVELDGQPVTAWTTTTGWVDPESIKRREARATAAVQFEGGIYRTKEVSLIPDIAVETEVM